MPLACDRAGVRELIVFDPSLAERPGGEGARFQIHRRQPDGQFRLQGRHDGDRAHSEVLDVWFRTPGFGDRTHVRIATGPSGDHLVPTLEEIAETERAAKEAERAAKEAALARVRALEALLAARGAEPTPGGRRAERLGVDPRGITKRSRPLHRPWYLLPMEAVLRLSRRATYAEYLGRRVGQRAPARADRRRHRGDGRRLG